MLHKAIDAQVKADANSDFATFTVSTGALDRDSDRLDPAGWDLATFRKNPVVLWAHDHSALPVGRAQDIRVADGALRARVQFVPRGISPLADTVRDLVNTGFLRAVSVGFRSEAYKNNDEGGRNFSRMELLEFSIVAVPSNPEALLAAGAKGVDLAPIVEWAKAFLGKHQHPGKVYLPVRVVREGLASKAPAARRHAIESLKDIAPGLLPMITRAQAEEAIARGMAEATRKAINYATGRLDD